MSFIQSRKGGGRKARIDLTEDFRHPDRPHAEYSFVLDGLTWSRDAAGNLLKDLCQGERPLLHLSLPRQEGEAEAREFKVHKLERNALFILDLSMDEESLSFLREHSWVRFGFEHRGGSFLFKARALGKAWDNEEILAVEKPEIVYQERRKYRRYQLLPELQAFLGWMQVQDISWTGMRILSDTFFQAEEELVNAMLSLPYVNDIETGECFYPGARIQVPGVVVSYRLTRDICYQYGVYFDQGWSKDQSEELANFLRALYKRVYASGRGKVSHSENYPAS